MSDKWLRDVAILACTASTAITPALAQAPPAGTETVYTLSIAVLIKFFVLALLLESALAVIFNWRVFQTLFDGRGWKTPVMIVVAWLVVTGFKIDWIKTLIVGYGGTASETDVLPSVLATLVLAGGSSGIYNLLVRLGYRAPVADSAPKPPPDEGWLAIKAIRKRAQGDIRVLLEKELVPPAPLRLAMAGIIGTGWSAGDTRNLFFRDRMRFPRSGGYVVDPGVAYRLQVAASDGINAIPCPIDGTYVFARGAIVDLTVAL